MAEPTQSFSSHTRWMPAYHFFAAPFSLIFFFWSVKRAITSPTADSLFMVVGALAILGLAAVSRVTPLRVQDRLIRLEERLRLYRVLPADLHANVEQFRPRQLIALRFAPDAELPDLARKLIATPAMTPKEIKQAIRQWRADHFRA